MPNIAPKRHSAAQSPKGEDQILNIMTAAKNVFIEHGRHGFSMRKIANEAGMAVGNLGYYYKSKDDILRDLLDHTISEYETTFDGIFNSQITDDKAKLKNIIYHIIEDLGRRETTRFFPELWSLANHDEYAANGMHLLYQRARRHMRILVSRINPALSFDQCRIVSLFISASLEGHTMFIGDEKPWSKARGIIAQIAPIALIDFVVHLTPSAFDEMDFADLLPDPAGDKVDASPL